MRLRWVLIAVLLGTLLAGCDVAAGLRVDLRANSTVGMPSGGATPALMRDQDGRRTCQSFAAVAALEAAYKRQMGLELDLSEEFVNYSGKMFWLAYDRYGAPLSAAARETQLSVWAGGKGTGWIRNLSHGYAVPAETVLPYRTGYSLTPYCGEGCGYGSPEYNSFFSTQRNVNNFNLNPANLPLTALTSDAYYSVRSYETVDARDPAAFERVLDQGYEIVWDFYVLGYRGSDSGGPIWRPRIFTENATITRAERGDDDALPNAPVRAILDVRQDDTVYQAGVDWEQSGNKVHWLGTDRPEALSEYTVKFRHENGGDTHAMLIIGYDPGLRYFLVKNSWGDLNTADLDADGTLDAWTLVSYEYVQRYGKEAGYITEVNPPRTWPELAFVGRWNLSMDGEHSGVLDIYHLPGIMQQELNNAYARDPSRYPGAHATDRRLGVYYDASGQAFRVNGSIEANHLTFYIDEDHPDLAIDQISGRRFDFYYFRDDPDTMAGFYEDEEGSQRGGYALRCPPEDWPVSDDWLDTDFDSPRPFTPESWIGSWEVDYDGVEAELLVTERDDSLVAGEYGVAGLAGEFTEGGSSRVVTVRAHLDDPSFLLIDLPSPSGSTRRALLRDLSRGTGVAAGSYVGAVDLSFGITMVSAGSALVAQIVSPPEGTLSRVRTHLFDVEVHYAVGALSYEWTSSETGLLSDQKSFSLAGTHLPTHQRVRVTVRDMAGNTASDDIVLDSPNERADLEILIPDEHGITFFQSQPISFTGKSFDSDHPPNFSLDDDEVWWTVGDSWGTPAFAYGHKATISGLSVGDHWIYFWGSDGVSGAHRDSVMITILPDPEDGDRAPEARITSPLHGAVFMANAQDGDGQWYINVTLEGEGFDPEDRELAGASLEWSDSVNDGPVQGIGTGSSLTVPLTAPNTFGNSHTITLTVRDSHGHTATDSITITVSQFS